jgi:hypothetical protein
MGGLTQVQHQLELRHAPPDVGGAINTSHARKDALLEEHSI